MSAPLIDEVALLKAIPRLPQETSPWTSPRSSIVALAAHVVKALMLHLQQNDLTCFFVERSIIETDFIGKSILQLHHERD